MAFRDNTTLLPVALQHLLLYSLLILGGLAGLYLFLNESIAVAMVFYILPISILFIFLCCLYPLLTFFLLYTISFLIMGLSRYIDLPVPAGVVLDLFILFNFLILGLHFTWGKKLGKLYITPFLLISILWMVFCFAQLLNPETDIADWATTIRGVGIHIVLLQVLVFLLLDSPDKLRTFFIFWGTLIILAALKGIGQKYLGFDGAEAAWVYGPGRHTHVIHSGIRYFSFFTDAANFGCHMGLGFGVFSVLAFFEGSRGRKVFYILVAALALHGMMISGTRAAMAVPFVGFSAFVLLLRKWQWIIAGTFALLLAFAFFNFTNIGNSNADIRRMRTAFRFAEDASFNVRLENQKKMRRILANRPFGFGTGSAKHTVESDMLYGIPTDSSFVFIWVENGIIGLLLYIFLCLAILGFGTFYILFVLRDPVIRGFATAATAGLSGILVAGYANEVLHQMPTGQTVYILMGIIMLSPYLDKQLHHGEPTL